MFALFSPSSLRNMEIRASVQGQLSIVTLVCKQDVAVVTLQD